MKKIKCIAMAIAAVIGGAAANGQNGEFDLSSQRKEDQNVRVIPGEKRDHHGVTVNPTPVSITIDPDRRVDVTGGYLLKGDYDLFEDELSSFRRNRDGVRMVIRYGEKAAGREGVKAIPGAYALRIDRRGISITGYDGQGVFYAIQTLKQILAGEAARGGMVPFVEVNDYPSLPNRGVVEGFYGTPWSHQVRLSLIEFYGEMKMNTYVYGPKDDPYHSSPNWREPYPEDEARNIRELVEACNEHWVDFVWAIHPGQDIKWNEEDYGNLVAKFQMMYDLGVRSYAIFFDDISGEGTNPYRQTELLNRLTKEFVQAKGDVAPLILCPTDYSGLWANPSPKGSLAIFGETLDPQIKIFWTGDAVCSNLTPSTLEFVNSRIRRPAYYWWNYPVTDYARHIMLQGPVYGLDTTLTSDQVCGVLSNPMEHGEASKLALYGVADYCWNIPAYNPIDNWERGLVYLAPEVSQAYRRFAIHSGDTETGYRRDESWETDTFTLAQWSDEAAARLEEEFEKIQSVPEVMKQDLANKALLAELMPWLEEFGKLGVRGDKAIELARIYRGGGSDSLFWNLYVENVMSEEDRENYEAHKTGTLKLQPFYEHIMDDMGYLFLSRISGETPRHYKGIGTFKNSGSVSTRLMLDRDSSTYYTSGVGQKEGDWIGLDLRDVREVKEIRILQGRNSVDDVDYFDNAVLECSVDGRVWMPLTKELKNRYIIEWSANPVRARYVRIRRLDSKRSNYASVRLFEIDPLRPDNLGFGIKTSAPMDALRSFDRNIGTTFDSRGGFAMEVPQGVKGFVMLMGAHEAPVIVREYGEGGELVSERSTDSAYYTMTLSGENVRSVSIEGDVRIFEIVPVVAR